MERIVKLTVSGLVATALVLTIGGVAAASTTTGVAVTSTSAKRPNVLTGPEIWRVVQPHQVFTCKQAPRRLKAIERAEKAAATRLTAVQARLSRVEARLQKVKGKKLMWRSKRAAIGVREFQKLEQEGQTLMSRIEKKCSASAPAT